MCCSSVLYTYMYKDLIHADAYTLYSTFPHCYLAIAAAALLIPLPPPLLSAVLLSAVCSATRIAVLLKQYAGICHNDSSVFSKGVKLMTSKVMPELKIHFTGRRVVVSSQYVTNGTFGISESPFCHV
jgi:hypothetical protein